MSLRLCLLAVAVFSGAHAAHSAAQDSAQNTGALEKVARFAIGKVLSYVLETEVSVGGIRLDKANELLEISDLRIANPKGFQNGNAFSLKRVRVEADPKLLFSDTPMIRCIEVLGAQAAVEINHKGINLKKLMDSASRLKPPGAGKSSPKDNANAKKWRISRALMENCSVDVTTVLPLPQTTHKELGKIDMDLSGPDGEGLPAGEAMTRVLQVIMERLELTKGLGGLNTLLNPTAQ